MAFWHGRILPATFYFRRRGIVVITSENFDGEWIARIIERFGYGTARGSTSRGATQGAAAAGARHEGGPAGRFHARRPARSGARGAARRGVAGRVRPATRCCRFTSRRRRTGACAAGTARRFPSRSAPWRWSSVSRSTCRARRLTRRSSRPTGARTASQRARDARCADARVASRTNVERSERPNDPNALGHLAPVGRDSGRAPGPTRALIVDSARP